MESVKKVNRGAKGSRMAKTLDFDKALEALEPALVAYRLSGFDITHVLGVADITFYVRGTDPKKFFEIQICPAGNRFAFYVNTVYGTSFRGSMTCAAYHKFCAKFCKAMELQKDLE